MRELDPRRTAVVNVHWQPDVVSRDGAFGPYFGEQVVRHGVVAKAAETIGAVRQAGGMVVYTRAVFRPGYPDLVANTPGHTLVGELGAFQEDSPKSGIIDELAPRPGDIVIRHVRLTGFFGTELDSILRRHAIETVLFTGVATNLAVLGTLFDAVNYGYRALLVSDACTAATDEEHTFALTSVALLGEVATTAEVVRALRVGAPAAV
jgi:nicotinamidase-related amidase